MKKLALFVFLSTLISYGTTIEFNKKASVKALSDKSKITFITKDENKDRNTLDFETNKKLNEFLNELKRNTIDIMYNVKDMKIFPISEKDISDKVEISVSFKVTDRNKEMVLTRLNQNGINEVLTKNDRVYANFNVSAGTYQDLEHEAIERMYSIKYGYNGINRYVEDFKIEKFNVLKKENIYPEKYTKQSIISMDINEKDLTKVINIANKYGMNVQRKEDYVSNKDEIETRLFNEIIKDSTEYAKYISKVIGEKYSKIISIKEDEILYKPYFYSLARSMDETSKEIEIQTKYIDISKNILLEFETTKPKNPVVLVLKDSETINVDPISAKIKVSISTKDTNLNKAGSKNQDIVDKLKDYIYFIDPNSTFRQYNYSSYTNNDYEDINISKMVIRVNNVTVENISDLLKILKYENISYNFDNGYLEFVLESEQKNKEAAYESVNNKFKNLKNKLYAYDLNIYKVMNDTKSLENNKITSNILNEYELTTNNLEKIGDFIELFKIFDLEINNKIEYEIDTNTISRGLFDKTLSKIDKKARKIITGSDIYSLKYEKINILSNSIYNEFNKYIDIHKTDKYEKVNINDFQLVRDLINKNKTYYTIPTLEVSQEIEVSYSR